MGGAYMAMSKEIQRGVLGVAGAPYAILLPRSSDFEPFFDIMTTKFNNPHEIELAMALFQQVWDPDEAGGGSRT